MATTLYTSKRTGNIPFIVDDWNIKRIKEHSWFMRGQYLATNLNFPGSVQKHILLHIFLFGKPKEGLLWDHKNRNSFDNREENLQQVDKFVSNRNVGVKWTSETGLKGVQCRPDRRRPWRSYIVINGIIKYLGSYFTPEEAVQARHQAEIQYWGKSY